MLASPWGHTRRRATPSRSRTVCSSGETSGLLSPTEPPVTPADEGKGANKGAEGAAAISGAMHS